MKILSEGSRGPSVELLQLGLCRAGFSSEAPDGIFGPKTGQALRQFQRENNLAPDGIAGRLSHAALMKWYTGFLRLKINAGDSFYQLSRKYGCTVSQLAAANPGADPDNLLPGSEITVPLQFDVVPENISYCSVLADCIVTGLCARYPFISPAVIGRSIMGKPLHTLFLGSGSNRVIYAAAFHANEWITCPLLLKFTEDLAKAFISGSTIFSRSAETILSHSTICLVPAVNPDGMDLAAGELAEGSFYGCAREISRHYPRYSFPSGWKANIAGTDLNLQFPAGWEQARENKYSIGITSPAPADFVGYTPLSAPESRALQQLTVGFDPALVLALHTQGRVIYWKYLDREPENSKKIASLFSSVSGYGFEDTPYAAGFAGYKDWFIQDFNRPGFTVEAGIGKNPLPLADFDSIYGDILGILANGALVT